MDAATLTEDDRAELQEYRRKDLLRTMQEISEEHWGRSWHGGLEHDLYLMTFQSIVPEYGMGPIEPARLAHMRRLAEQTQIWWASSSSPRQPLVITLEEAERRFSKLVAQDDLGNVHTLSVHEAKEWYAQAAAGDWDTETVSAPMAGMSSWHLLRLRKNPLISLVYRAEQGDWELRFGDTTLDHVRPTWAKRP